jgi:hypothetical protein
MDHPPHHIEPLRLHEAQPKANWNEEEEVYEPWPLRWYIWVPFVLGLLALAAGLEAAFRIGNDRQGMLPVRESLHRTC